MEQTMLLWLYAISAFYTASLLIRRRTAVGPRVIVSVAAVGVVSLLGVLLPEVEKVCFIAATIGFAVFLILPGLLVRYGRSCARRGSFGRATALIRTAVVLFPAKGIVAERDIYRAIRDRGGEAHPVAEEIKARLQAATQPPIYRAAPASTALMGLVLVSFLVESLLGDSRSLLTLLELGANHSPLVIEGQVYRFFTAIFLHSGLLHLIFNLGAIWILGRWVEPDLKASRTLLVFLLSGVLGNVASMGVYWADPVVAAGASGGAMGLLGCSGVLLFKPEGNPERARRLPSLVLVIVATLAVGVLVPGIDNGAHLGGLLTGALLGLFFTRVSRLPDRVVRGLTGLLILLAVVSIGLLARDYPRWRDVRPVEFADCSMNVPTLAVAEASEDGVTFTWSLLGGFRVEVVEDESDPARRAEERLRAELNGGPGELCPLAAPLSGYRGAGEIKSEQGSMAVEVYVLPEPGGRRTAVLTFGFAPGDPLIRERLVTPVVTSFTFR